MRQLFLGQEIGRRDTLRAIGCFGSFRNVLPDPRPVFNDAEANDAKEPPVLHNLSVPTGQPKVRGPISHWQP